jgi:dienelactone hydrolase
MATTQEYAPGRLVDVHGEGTRGIVLLWHGRGADSRTDVAGLAEEIAGHGLTVVVPDWSSYAPDSGRADLLASLEHARGVAADREVDPDRLVVVGWSLGGTAAVGLVTLAPGIPAGIAATGRRPSTRSPGPRCRTPCRLRRTPVRSTC